MENKTQTISILDDKTAKKFSKDLQKNYFNLNSKNSFLTDKGLSYLLSTENSKYIKEINLSENYSCITDESLIKLANSQFSSGITKISLKDTNITDEGIKEFISSPNFNNLEEIDLYGLYSITDQTLIVLSESYFVSNLKKINLKNTSITDRGFQILVSSPNSQKIVELDISENYPRITDNSLIALSLSEFLTNIKILRCMGNKITDKGIQYLMDSRNILELEEFDVSEHARKKNTFITDLTLNTMAYSHFLKSLKILNLRSTNIGTKGLIDFFASYNVRKLEILRISNNENVTDIALMSLMESDNLYNLKKLYINDTSVSAEALENLKKQKFLLDLIY